MEKSIDVTKEDVWLSNGLFNPDHFDSLSHFTSQRHLACIDVCYGVSLDSGFSGGWVRPCELEFALMVLDSSGNRFGSTINLDDHPEITIAFELDSTTSQLSIDDLPFPDDSRW